MSANPPPNGWHEWSRYVLKELKRQDDGMRTQADEITELKQEIVRREEREKAAKEQNVPERVGMLEGQMIRMQVKAGVWGAVGAAIPVIAGYLLSR